MAVLSCRRTANTACYPGALRDVDVDELRYTAGGGMQYNTPVGPFRLDYGYKLDKEPDESESEIHFSLGHAF